MRAMRLLTALLAATLTLAVGATAAAQDFPKLSGRVVDQADLLPPADEAALTEKLAGFEARSQQQIVVATVNSLNGRDVAEYGVALGRKWGIGTSERSDGVVFLIAPNERRMHIAVGYGLEPVLTDALSGRIIRDVVTPRFKANDYVGGINAGADTIIAQIELPPEQARANANAAESKSGGGAGLFFLLFWLLVLFLVIIPILRGRRRGKKYRKNRPWGAPVIIWGGGNDWGSGRSSGGSSWGSGGFGGGGGFGGFSGGGGSFGGGGASGGW